MAYEFTPPCKSAESLPLSTMGADGKEIQLINYPDGPSPPDGPLPFLSTVEYRPGFASVKVDLDGNAVVGDYGAMIWQVSNDGELAINTSCHLGGLCAMYWRQCSGEAKCNNQYSGKGTIAFGFDLPGDMLPFSCKPDKGWIISKGGFICGTPNLVLSGKFKGCQALCCSGEGGFLTHVTIPQEATNLFYAGGFGAITLQSVPDGMSLFVNTGLFFAAKDSIEFNVTIPGDCYSCLFSGEGFVMTFDGPIQVYTQNRDPDVFMRLLHPPPAKQGANSEDGAGAGS